MSNSRRRGALQRLLDLCDQVQRIRHRLADPELSRATQVRLARQSRLKASKLAHDVSAYRFRGPLGDAMRAFRFGVEHFQILAILLQRHMRSEEPTLEGRLILSAVFDSSFEALAGIELLHESAPLRRSGLVVVEEDEPPARDVLATRFRIADEAIDAFCAEAATLVPEDQKKTTHDRYANHRELLADLRLLHNLYAQRSARVFPFTSWDRVPLGRSIPADTLTRRIREFSDRVKKKISQSEGAAAFPVLRLMREHGLSEQELVIVIHLLFQELYDGDAHGECTQLLRLVSGNEDELIRNRRLFAAKATLVSRQIVQVEHLLEGRELTGEAHLADWVVTELFGTQAEGRAIAADERLNWHMYLKSLGDSGKFFDDLEKH